MRKTARITIIATGITSVLAAGSTAMALSVPVHDRHHHDGDAPETGQVTGISRFDGSAAAQAARTRLPGAQVTEIERETEHGHQLREIELTRGGRDYEALVDATGEVVNLHVDDGPARDHDRYGDDKHDDADHDAEGDHDSDHGEVHHDD